MNDWQRHIGVGGVNYALGRTGPTRDRTLIADEGPRKGRPAAIETDYKDGRQDARVFTDTHREKARMPLCKPHRNRALRDGEFLASIRRPATITEVGMWLTTTACVVCGEPCDIDPLNRKDVA